MFSRFTTALYNAVDALAPPLPLQEDFIWHWKSVTKFYTGKNASNKIPIEETSIPGHLSEMLSILEQEEKEVELGNIGPCMEYIMQHKLLDTMCVLATSDSPPGMKRYMFEFITEVLNITQQTLIPHISIYIPIQNFIKLCGEVIAGPTEVEEMCFLQSICDKLKENPHLVNCFLGTVEGYIRRRDSCEKSQDDSTKEYALITSLLKLYQSPDGAIASKAGMCLKICCTHTNDTAAMTVVQSTDLSHKLCEHLGVLYKGIPKTMKLCDIENPTGIEDDVGNATVSSNIRKFLCYIQQLAFIDSMVQDVHPVIADNLCTCFRTEFLTSYIYPDLVEDENLDHILFVTTVISSSIRHVVTPKLIATFGTFLLGDDDSFDFASHSSHVVKDTLIERCRKNDESLALSMSNLQLFEELLQRPTQNILHNLVIKHLEGRTYYDHTAVDSWLQNSDEDDVNSRHSDDSTSESTTPTKPIPTYIHRIIDCFLALLPDDIKSCESDEDSGYDTYLKEAHRRVVESLKICEDFEWPDSCEDREDSHQEAEDDSSSESQPEADSQRWPFHEGPFLHMLFDKLERMLYQPYDINLQVTSIISHLALFAHPHLNEYFLNPLLPFTLDARSPFQVLFKVSEEIQKLVPDIKGFKTKIKLTRNALLSDGNEYATFEETNALEALIVLEEFCKELAAIAFVKYSIASQ